MGLLHNVYARLFRLSKAADLARPSLPRAFSPMAECLETRVLLAANPIVVENQLPGTPQSEWDVVGAGDPNLQGYATDISVNQGQTVSFKVDDKQSAAYHIDIYRMGYYGGAGARKVATIASSQTTKRVQPAPLFDSTTGLLDAGNWSVTASWAVPAAATSGIYFAKLVREDTGGASHIFFIVRNDASHSDLLFQTSDSTWQAYNDYGGESVYTGNSGDADDRAVKVSYNRPLVVRGTQGGLGDYNSPFHAEYPMVRWIEANGYDVSYFTDVDSDRNGALIKNHKAFLSVGHDEYWSGGQRANVEAARDAGVNLAFFSGNEVFWKTRWENSTDASHTSYRTLVTYKESKANAKTDPAPVWTGTWRDDRFSPPYDGGRPENALTGTAYMNDRTNVDIGISMNVSAADGKLRFWRNTPLANLAAGQVATVGDRVVGYETDEDLDNGFRPAGLMDMSSTTFTTTSHVNVPWGSTVGPGTSTHSITLYRAASGALVFGAGTVQWSWGLDGEHDNGSSVPDPSMRQATVNLLADMGVQPQTLQAGLLVATASTDATGPTSVIASPLGGTFTAGTPVTIAGTATDSGGGIVAGVEVSTDGGRTWHKATGRGTWTYVWTPTASGPATLLSRAVDDSGNVESPGGGVTVSVRYVPTSTTGLVAEYNFDQGTGTSLTDVSGNGHTGTITGPTWTTGKFGQGLSFSGAAGNWVTIADANSLDLTTGMTLEAWVKPATSTGYQTAIMKERAGGLSYALYAEDGTGAPPSTYVNNTNGGSDSLLVGSTAIAANTWNHIASTYDGSTLRLYVNGFQVASEDVSGAITVSNGVLRLGGNSNWGDAFQGAMDDVRIYNRPLSLAEIRSDLSTPIGGTTETTAPTVAVTAPATATGTVVVGATATDNVALAGVQFLLNGVAVGATDTVAPYTFSWDTAKWANGTYVLTAQATDMAGNTVTSSGVSVLVNNPADVTPPSVRMTEPATGTTISGPVVLGAFATDDIGVVGIRFEVNGVAIGSEDTTAPYRVTWNSSSVPNGTYDVVAIARDAAGNLTTSAPVRVTVDHAPPVVLSKTPAAGVTDAGTSSPISLTFDESIVPSSATVTLRDPAGNVVAGNISYDDAAHALTFTHRNSLNPSATYTVTVSGVKDLAGNAMSPVSWSFTTVDQIVNASIWSDQVTPTVASSDDGTAVELGVKFRSNYDGYITGIRFYKGAGNTGTHVGHLWSAAGTLLATATFSGETAVGWQTVLFSKPVAIAANTTYVASYYAPAGNYSADAGYFAGVGADSGPLHALATGVDGANGVFSYANGGGFPTGSFGDTNYWVDVVFSTDTISSDTTAPTVVTQSPGSGATAVATGSKVTVTFSESVQPDTISLVLKDAAGHVVPATVVYDDPTATATLTPTGSLSPSTTYTVSVAGAQDAAANVMAPVTWSFQTAASVAPAPGAQSIWSDTAVPATASVNDTNAVELGVKFRSDVAGTVTGIRFYKGSANTGTHVGHLWSSTGQLLATVTFAGESGSGWQTALLSAPVTITANTTYVVSYYAPVGGYAASGAYFAAAGTDSGSLHALGAGVDGANGLYHYAAGGAFPTDSYNSTNYWVDVVFDAGGADTTPPAVASQSPAPGATGVAPGANVTATFNEGVQAGTILFTLANGSGNPVGAKVIYDPSTRTATLDTASDLAPSTTYTVSLTGAKDAAGNTMAPVTWTFTTAAGSTIWSDTTIPATASVNDTNAVELGVKFRSDVAGFITGLRFYKGSANTGTHVGHLWSSTGQLLATATFVNEAASGWQTVLFSQPVAVSANTTYVASYYAPKGGYAASGAYFAAAGTDSGSLHALGAGVDGANGLYHYAAGGAFPTDSYNSTNYWVDVVFATNIGDVTAPTATATTPAAGAVGASPIAPITATFSEPVQQGSVVFAVTDPANNPVAASISFGPTGQVMTLTPVSPLSALTTYSVTLSGARDAAGNVMAPVTWTFTTAGAWQQTTAVDFGTGTGTGTAVTSTSGGEVQLAASFRDDFDAAALSATDWTNTSWASAGGGPASVSESGGVLSIAGSQVLSAQTLGNVSVEGRIAFGQAAFQHFGVATGLDTVSGNSWAMFSTRGTSDRLYARVNNAGSETYVDLGAIPTGFHVYRVQPSAGGFQFLIDNVLYATVAGNFPAGTPLRVALSAFQGAPQPALQADWVHVASYVPSGTFISSTFNAGRTVAWEFASWTANLPAGTSLLVETSSSLSPDGGWSNWTAVGTGGSIGSPAGQYLRYRITISSTDPNVTASLLDISVYYH